MTKIYFASAEVKTNFFLLKKAGVKSFLLSFFVINNSERTPEFFKEVFKYDSFLDSGGYSFRVSKKEKKSLKDYLDSYIQFIKKHNVKTYANLDLATYEESIKNQRYMESKGLNPIPVYHYSEFKDDKHKEVLIDYCKNHKFVAIGGVAGANIPQTNQTLYLKYCFETAKKYGTKLHGFGITKPDIIKKFPFYSVDSTTWNNAGRFGETHFFEKNTIKCYPKKMFEKKFKRKFDPKILHEFNLLNWKKFADYMEEKKCSLKK